MKCSLLLAEIEQYNRMREREASLALSFFFQFQGTDDSVLPFLDGIAKSGIDGRALAVLDEDILCSAGVTKLGVRRLILQAVQLLLRFVRFMFICAQFLHHITENL